MCTVELSSLTVLRVQNLKHNFAIVDALTEIATRKRLSPAQLSIAWVSARGPHVVPLPGSSCVLTTPLESHQLLTQTLAMRSGR
jgi:aryl-alcohol dehydrogenase-like predicted oxidoreductase